MGKFGDINRIFYEESPFKRTHVDGIAVSGFEDYELPGVYIETLERAYNLSYANAIKFLHSLEGRAWPQIDIPIMFKRGKDYKLVVNKTGVFAKNNKEETIATIFVPPIKPDRVIKDDDKVHFVFGKFIYTTSLYPSISEFLSNIVIAFEMSKNADIIQEFNIF